MSGLRKALNALTRELHMKHGRHRHIEPTWGMDENGKRTDEGIDHDDDYDDHDTDQCHDDDHDGDCDNDDDGDDDD